MGEGDQFCLQRILARWMKLRNDLDVWYYHAGHRRWKEKIPDYHPVSGRARFRFTRKRLTVYRNRLIWMLVHKREIPSGYVVDHKDGNRENDHPDNLELMLCSASNLQGQERQEQQTAEMLSRYFEFVGKYGREPSLPQEISYVEDGF